MWVIRKVLLECGVLARGGRPAWRGIVVGFIGVGAVMLIGATTAGLGGAVETPGRCRVPVVAPCAGTVADLGPDNEEGSLLVYVTDQGAVNSVGRLAGLADGVSVGSTFEEGDTIGYRLEPCEPVVVPTPTPVVRLSDVARTVVLQGAEEPIQIVGSPKSTLQLAREAREDLRKTNPNKYDALVALESAAQRFGSKSRKLEADMRTYAAQCTGASEKVVVKKRQGDSDQWRQGQSETKTREATVGADARVGAAAGADSEGRAAAAAGGSVGVEASRSAKHEERRWVESRQHSWDETVSWTTLEERSSTPFCQKLFQEIQNNGVIIRQELLPVVERARSAGWTQGEIERILEHGGLPSMIVR